MTPLALDFHQRKLAFIGVLLLTIGFFTGIWSAAALSGMVPLKVPRLALAAHLNGLMGGLWILAVAFTRPLLNYGPRQFQRLALLTWIPAWANWFITLIASLMGVNGLSYNGHGPNDLIALLLQIFVVVPSLAASLYWTRGFIYKGNPA